MVRSPSFSCLSFPPSLIGRYSHSLFVLVGSSLNADEKLACLWEYLSGNRSSVNVYIRWYHDDGVKTYAQTHQPIPINPPIPLPRQKTQITKSQKQNLPQTRNPPALRLLQKPWHRTLLPTRPFALYPALSRALLRLIRRQRRSSLRIRRQISRPPINSRRPSVDEANDDRQDTRRRRNASDPRR